MIRRVLGVHFTISGTPNIVLVITEARIVRSYKIVIPCPVQGLWPVGSVAVNSRPI